MMKCSCGGKIERINRKQMRCIICGSEFPVLPDSSIRKNNNKKKKLQKKKKDNVVYQLYLK